MSLCSSFVDNVECALVLQNDYNIKLLIIGLVLAFAVAAILYYKHFSTTKSNSSLFIHYSLKVLPWVYIVFSPFALLMLRHTLSIEIFILAYVGIALGLLALVIGFSLMFGIEYTFKLVGIDISGSDYEQAKKYKSTNKKYG